MLSPMKILASAALLVALAVPAAASAKGDCPPRKGTLAHNGVGRIWHQRTSLYGCTTVYGHNPRARRLGPYKTGVKVTFDGVEVAWTVPLTRDGVRSDRVYAGNVDDGSRWLLGRRLVPATASAPEHEARLQKLVLRDQSVAWVTTDSDLVFAMRSPDADPTPIGTLPAPLAVDRNLLLVGSFPTTDPAALAATMELKELNGEGDECGGSNPYTLTAKPDPASARIGARWFGSWASTNCL